MLAVQHAAQAICHEVEVTRQGADLVPPVYSHTCFEIAGGQRLGGVAQAAQRAAQGERQQQADQAAYGQRNGDANDRVQSRQPPQVYPCAQQQGRAGVGQLHQDEKASLACLVYSGLHGEVAAPIPVWTLAQQWPAFLIEQEYRAALGMPQTAQPALHRFDATRGIEARGGVGMGLEPFAMSLEFPATQMALGAEQCHTQQDQAEPEGEEDLAEQGAHQPLLYW